MNVAFRVIFTSIFSCGSPFLPRTNIWIEMHVGTVLDLAFTCPLTNNNVNVSSNSFIAFWPFPASKWLYEKGVCVCVCVYLIALMIVIWIILC